MEKCPILQSGFISLPNSKLVSASVSKDPFVDFTLNKDYLKSKNNYFYSLEVSDMYDKWRANNALLKDFDFREKLLLLAFDSFRCVDFSSWIAKQEKSNHLSDLHNLFICETMGFNYGYPRTIQVAQWVNLLEATVQVKATKIDVKEYLKKKNGCIGIVKDIVQQSNLTYDVIKYWTTQPNGFEDLLVSLFVIFGSRNTIGELSEITREI